MTCRQPWRMLLRNAAFHNENAAPARQGEQLRRAIVALQKQLAPASPRVAEGPHVALDCRQRIDHPGKIGFASIRTRHPKPPIVSLSQATPIITFALEPQCLPDLRRSGIMKMTSRLFRLSCLSHIRDSSSTYATSQCCETASVAAPRQGRAWPHSACTSSRNSHISRITLRDQGSRQPHDRHRLASVWFCLNDPRQTRKFS
jgi:hypothetical protein